VADAVLFEGYALYPYRASAGKNQLRWQFGVLLPRTASETLGCDPWWTETQCLIASSTGEPPAVEGRVRFLRLERRQLQALDGEPLASLELDDQLLVSWDEGHVCELDFRHTLPEGARSFDFDLAGERREEALNDASGSLAARLVRTRGPLKARVSISAAAAGTEPSSLRLTVRTENLTDGERPSGAERAARDRALPSAMLGVHLLLSTRPGEFLSVVDPPPWAERAARACRSIGAWPVLAGAPGAADLLLSAPIILYDHPQVAPESPGDLFDATEIDEILTLRTRLLTDEEKREARATDPRLASLIDRVDGISPEAYGRLHGALRDPHQRAPAVGTRVRLQPGARRTDAQDMFLAGRTATIAAVHHDVEGQLCVAVTIDDDPGAELHRQRGRFHYFHADEIEPYGEH
jgi:hypothetical protein